MQQAKGNTVVSTMPSQINFAPTWKQEVNRRLAEHRTRKSGPEQAEDMQSPAHATAGSRAAAAAARVAQRFANAPSYSEMLADEARAAVRAAEAASRAAQQAHAAAKSVLAGLEAAASVEPEPSRPQPVAVVEPPRPVESMPAPEFAVRWEPDFPERPAEPEPMRAVHGLDVLESELDAWRRASAQVAAALPMEEYEMAAPVAVEPAQPIHANLIEFPRELVAARKARPRLAEAAVPYAAAGAQLSIFEVDPQTISTEPLEETVVASEPTWPAPEWSAIKLEAAPVTPTLVEPARPEPAPPALELAPTHQRLLALVVDGALMTSAFLAAAYTAVANVATLPSLRTVEIGAAAAFAAITVVYYLFFFTLGKGTPGMKYARIRLSTLEGKAVSRAQRWSRLGSLALSLLPVGLGVAWALFDEDRLSWHDRLSGTYLRKA